MVHIHMSTINCLSCVKKGATGRLDNGMMRLAQEWRAMQPTQRADHMTSYRQSLQAARDAHNRLQMQQGLPAQAGNGGDGNENDPQTHFGMGTSTSPVSVKAWQRTLNCDGALNRGGLRRVSNGLFKESDLIVKPRRKRLSLPESFRLCCWKSITDFVCHQTQTRHLVTTKPYMRSKNMNPWQWQAICLCASLTQSKGLIAPSSNIYMYRLHLCANGHGIQQYI